MSIVYDPSKMLRKLAPERKVKRLMTGRVSLKRTALAFLNDADFIDKKRVVDVALKVMSNYKERIAAESVEKSEVVDDPAQLIQRVQNEVVLQVSEGIKDQYNGESYVWLPSDADEPDPEHQLNYGKTFVVGEGEMPGERYGCRCGMEILVKQTELNLG